MPPKNDKKEAILEAMLDLVVERGFHNAPMSLLSKRSGASTGIIYHYFPSKEELIHALYLRVKATKTQVLLDGYTTDMPLAEAFVQIWTNAYHFYRTHNRESRFLDQYENSPFSSYTPTTEAPPEEAPDESASQAPTDQTPKDKHSAAKARFIDQFRAQKEGGVLKDLPPVALYGFSFGMAARLAKATEEFDAVTLKQVAEAAWQAISAE
jgi:AcrR family transcriptional regulator